MYTEKKTLGRQIRIFQHIKTINGEQRMNLYIDKKNIDI